MKQNELEKWVEANVPYSLNMEEEKVAYCAWCDGAVAMLEHLERQPDTETVKKVLEMLYKSNLIDINYIDSETDLQPIVEQIADKWNEYNQR